LGIDSQRADEESMVIRTWRGLASAANPHGYPEHFTRTAVPALERIEGFLGASLLREDREDAIEFLVLTRWTSLDAIRSFAGETIGQAVVEPEAAAALIDFDRTVHHYHVVAEVSAP
jgi:heme-degrading monooxygenase HmoA